MDAVDEVWSRKAPSERSRSARAAAADIAWLGRLVRERTGERDKAAAALANVADALRDAGFDLDELSLEEAVARCVKECDEARIAAFSRVLP